ncbi:MAG: tyrosine-type recombinase/integrase [Pseudomonadota bacterium]
MKRTVQGRVVEYHSIRGTPRSRFWRTGDSPVGSPEYIAAYQAVVRRPSPANTFDAVINAYLESAEYRDKAQKTREDYLRLIGRIRDKFGSAPVEAFNRPEIRTVALQWRDQFDGRTRDYVWAVLRRIVGWANDRNLIRQHHLRGGGTTYRANRADIIWTTAEISTFCQSAPGWLRRALVAATETGLRPADLVKLTRGQIVATPRGRRLQVRTSKSGGRQIASIPVTAAMAHIVDETPTDRLLILVNGRGQALCEKWLSKAVRKHCRVVGLGDRLRLYDARGTACTRLLRAGAKLDHIALAMGWSKKTAADMLERYARLDPDLTDAILDLLENKSVQ